MRAATQSLDSHGEAGSHGNKTPSAIPPARDFIRKEQEESLSSYCLRRDPNTLLHWTAVGTRSLQV